MIEETEKYKRFLKENINTVDHIGQLRIFEVIAKIGELQKWLKKKQ